LSTSLAFISAADSGRNHQLSVQINFAAQKRFESTLKNQLKCKKIMALSRNEFGMV